MGLTLRDASALSEFLIGIGVLIAAAEWHLETRAWTKGGLFDWMAHEQKQGCRNLLRCGFNTRSDIREYTFSFS